MRHRTSYRESSINLTSQELLLTCRSQWCDASSDVSGIGENQKVARMTSPTNLFLNNLMWLINLLATPSWSQSFEESFEACNPQFNGKASRFFSNRLSRKYPKFSILPNLSGDKYLIFLPDIILSALVSCREQDRNFSQPPRERRDQ